MSNQPPVPQPGRPATNAPTKDDVELPPEPRGLLRTFSRQYYRHPTIIDISIAAGVAAYSLTVAIPLLLRPNSPARAYPILPLAPIAIALMGVALSLRRRFPLRCWAAIPLIPETYQFAVLQASHLNMEQLMYVATGISDMGLVSISIVLGVVASHRKPPAAWIVGGISLVVPVTDIVLTNPGLTIGEILRNAAILILLTLVGILVGFNTCLARLRSKAIELHSARMTLASEQVVLLAAIEERSCIAREMHDAIAHSLTVMITMADGAAAIMERDSATAKQAIETLAEVGRSALADIRRLVGVLREDPSVAAKQVPQSPESPAPSGESPLSVCQHETRDPPVPEFALLGTMTPVEPSVPIVNLHQQAIDGADGRSRGDLPLAPSPEQADITELIKRSMAVGALVTYRWVGAALPVSKALQFTVLRIAQEALTNVLRYAPATPVVGVDVERHNGIVVLTVDNEAASDTCPMHRSGKGLIGMRERASVYGGTIQAGPTSTGWRVCAVLRWDEHDEGTLSWQIPL